MEQGQGANEYRFGLDAPLFRLCKNLQGEVSGQYQGSLDFRLDTVIVRIEPFGHGAGLRLLRAACQREVDLQIHGGLLRGTKPFRYHAEHHRMAQESIVRICVKDRDPLDPLLLLHSIILSSDFSEGGLHLSYARLPSP